MHGNRAPSSVPVQTGMPGTPVGAKPRGMSPSSNATVTALPSLLTSATNSSPPSQDRATALARHGAVELPGNPALAFTQPMVDRGGNSGDHARHRTARRGPLETFGKLLGDEAGRKLGLAPARMLHERGEERDVVPNTVDGESIERIGLRSDRLARAWRHG